MFVIYFKYSYCAMISEKYQTFINNGISEVSHLCMKDVYGPAISPHCLSL